MKRLLPLSLFAGLLLLFAVLLITKPDPRDAQSMRGEALPKLTLRSLDGKQTWQTESLRAQVTVLNFFASWCSPCAAEMPELAALQQKYPRVKLHGVAWNDTPEALQKWLRQHGNPFHTVWLDPNGQATIDLGIKGIPETVVVDANGVIRYRLMGALTAPVRAEIIDPLLTQLLDEAGDAP